MARELLGNIKGPKGDPGPGVPAGGLEGSKLIKNSDADYDTIWENAEVSSLVSNLLTNMVIPTEDRTFTNEITEPSADVGNVQRTIPEEVGELVKFTYKRGYLGHFARYASNWRSVGQVNKGKIGGNVLPYYWNANNDSVGDYPGYRSIYDSTDYNHYYMNWETYLSLPELFEVNRRFEKRGDSLIVYGLTDITPSTSVENSYRATLAEFKEFISTEDNQELESEWCYYFTVSSGSPWLGLKRAKVTRTADGFSISNKSAVAPYEMTVYMCDTGHGGDCYVSICQARQHQDSYNIFDLHAYWGYEGILETLPIFAYDDTENIDLYLTTGQVNNNVDLCDLIDSTPTV